MAGCGCCRHSASGGKKPGQQSYGINLAQTTQCETPVARLMHPSLACRLEAEGAFSVGSLLGTGSTRLRYHDRNLHLPPAVAL